MNQIMKKMRTNERKEFNSKRRHEQREQYERKLILFRRVRIGRHPFGYMDTPLGYRDTLLQHVMQ
jgi:hypothetical protein